MDTVQALSVSCNHCGAPLQVPVGTRYVTCTYCGARLEVHRSGNAAYTEVLEALQQKTTQIAGDVEAIRVQNEIERLDREWMMEREGYMVRDKHGGRHVPTAASSVVVSVVMVAFAIFWMSGAASLGAGSLFVGIGALFVVIAIASGVNGARKAWLYADGEQRYQARRRALADELAERR
jgi:hypothetical protein